MFPSNMALNQSLGGVYDKVERVHKSVMECKTAQEVCESVHGVMRVLKVCARVFRECMRW